MCKYIEHPSTFTVKNDNTCASEHDKQNFCITSFKIKKNLAKSIKLLS